MNIFFNYRRNETMIILIINFISSNFFKNINNMSHDLLINNYTIFKNYIFYLIFLFINCYRKFIFIALYIAHYLNEIIN